MRATFRSLPLYWQTLLVYTSLGLLPVLALLFWEYDYSRQQLIQLKTEQLWLVAQEKKQQLQASITHQRQYIEQVASAPLVVRHFKHTINQPADQEAILLDELATRFLQQHQHHQWFLVDLSKTVTHSVNDSFLRGEQLSEQSDWWSHHPLTQALHASMRSQKTVVQPFLWDDLLEQVTNIIAAPVRDMEHRVQGYLLITLGKRWLFDVIEQRHGLGQTGEINLGYVRTDQSVDVLTRPRFPVNSDRQRQALNGQPIPLERALQGSEGLGESIDYRAQPVIAAWLSLPEAGIGLVVKQDKSELLAELADEKEFFLLLATLLTLTFIMVAAWQSQRQTRLIRQLSFQAKQLGRGFDYQPLSAEAASSPEILDLIDGLNLSAQQIEQQFDLLSQQAAMLEEQAADLEQSNQNLESEVMRKTAALNTYIDIVDDHVITSRTDLDGNITYASSAFCRISGYEKDELLGKNHRIVRHPDMPASLYTDLWRTITHGQEWHGEILNCRKDGTGYWVDAHISPIRDEYGKVTGYMAVRQDITNRKLAEALSITDEMTQLYNRRYFQDQFDKLWRLVARNRQLLTFVMLDVDHFKRYNDSMGHHAGDQVLIAVAQVLKQVTRRAGELAFRLGGEEMGLLAMVDNPEHALQMAEQIQAELAHQAIPHPDSPTAPVVTVSIGLCFFDGRKCEHAIQPDIDMLYQLADSALYQAKEQGRNQIVSCGEGLCPLPHTAPQPSTLPAD